jgi:hypothetical protein
MNIIKRYHLLKLLSLGFITSLIFFQLEPITTSFADQLYSSEYNIDMSNLNITGGRKTGGGYNLTDTVGQTIQGQFDVTGYRIRAGFQYINSLIPFTFIISKLAIDFGTLSPLVPKTDTHTLTISSGAAYGFAVTAIEDHRLQIDNSNYIIDTTCDSATPCTITDANIWSDDTNSYGFGYNMSGDNVDTTDFATTNHYRPFANASLSHTPTVVMESSLATRSATSTIKYKVNIGGSQQAGNYENGIQFIATPTY